MDICYDLKKLYVASIMLDMFRDFESRIFTFIEKIKNEEDIIAVAAEYKSLRSDLKFLLNYYKDKMEWLRDLAEKYYLDLEYRELISSIESMIRRPFSAMCHYMEFFDAWSRLGGLIDEIAEEVGLGDYFSSELMVDFSGAMKRIVDKLRKHDCSGEKNI